MIGQQICFAASCTQSAGCSVASYKRADTITRARSQISWKKSLGSHFVQRASERTMRVMASELPQEEAAVETSSTPTAVTEGGEEERCKTCGVKKSEMAFGCDGSGRIMGGIGAVPGFSWWPIKAYRPCGKATSAGIQYQRKGQGVDEVMFGRGPGQ